jgi:hypothetical protein
MPTGHIFERLGGMIGSPACSGKTDGTAKANHETQRRILIFTWHLAQGDVFTGSQPAFFPLPQQAGGA